MCAIFASIAQAIEAPQLRQNVPPEFRARIAQTAFQLPTELLRIAARGAVHPLPAARKSGVDARALKKQAHEFGWKSLRRLASQQREARHIFVDLGLHLQLQNRYRLVVARIPREIHKVAHALERRPIVSDVARVEMFERIGALQTLEEFWIKIQRHADGIALLDDDELLFARGVGRGLRQAAALGDEKIVHVVRDGHVVDAANEILNPPENHQVSA